MRELYRSVAFFVCFVCALTCLFVAHRHAGFDSSIEVVLWLSGGILLFVAFKVLIGELYVSIP